MFINAIFYEQLFDEICVGLSKGKNSFPEIFRNVLRFVSLRIIHVFLSLILISFKFKGKKIIRIWFFLFFYNVLMLKLWWIFVCSESIDLLFLLNFRRNHFIAIWIRYLLLYNLIVIFHFMRKLRPKERLQAKIWIKIWKLLKLVLVYHWKCLFGSLRLLIKI